MEALFKNTVQPDCHDERDHQFCNIHGENAPHIRHIDCPKTKKQTIENQLKPQVDLRHLLYSPIINQGLLNACSACAFSVAAELYLINEDDLFVNKTIETLNVSPMFIYFNERVIENKVDLNTPVFLRDGIKALAKHGACSNDLWPYPEMAYPESIAKVVEEGNLTAIQQEVTRVLTEHESEIHAALVEKPTENAITQAGKHKILRYCSLSINENFNEIKLALSKNIPVVFGMAVPKSFFEIGTDGVMPMPNKNEVRIGGHAMVIVGYDDEKSLFTVRNSYGKNFGDKGYCYIPYDFFTDTYNTEDSEASNTFSYWCLTSSTEI